MKLLDYIQGLRKGKEAHRLEKESMKDSFLADAMDGYHQIEGDHAQRIEKLRMQVSAHTTHTAKKKKKNSYAITWSIAACLVIGIGISSYFIFLKKSMTEDALITKEITPSAVMEPKPNSAPSTDMQLDHRIARGQSETSKQMIALEKSVTADTDTFLTNINGEFTLENNEKQKQLKAQYIGFHPVEIPVDTNQVMLIAMNEDKRSLDEVVVVGYGTQKKSILTGSVAKAPPSQPQPTVDQRKYKKYLKNHLIRPNDDKCKDVKGKVLVTFFVDQEGNPQQITVKKGLCEAADNEAIRLIKEGPKWIPGDQDLPVEITVQF